MSRLAIATGNLGGAADPPLSRFLTTKAGTPHLIALPEAQNADGKCHEWATRHGYRVLGEQTDVTALVRRDLIRADVGPVPMSEPWWWGPSRDRLHRRRPRVHLQVNVAGVDVLYVHNPPGGPEGAAYRTGGRNKAAWRESADLERDWDGPVVGDLNALASEVERHIGPAAMTGKVDGVVHHGWRHQSTHRIRDNEAGHGWGVVVLTKE